MSGPKVYDLEERSLRFSEVVIALAKKLPHTVVSRPIISQLIRASTSIGANYCEADDAESRKDFIHKIGIAKKEARETRYWLKLISSTFPEFSDDITKLISEATQLNLILNAITHSTRKNSAALEIRNYKL